ncbi:MAG: hypothetical protein HY718_10335, partial [Planctomycetes bacterium]|nr:hypothetical protein [Planctomycetota bacterium]
MTKLVVGGIVVVGIAIVSFVVAGAKHERPSQPPGTVAAAAASGAGSIVRESSRAAGAPVGDRAVPASSQPANAKSPTTKPTNESGANNVVAALRQAADAKKHLFVFVYEKDDEQTREGRKTFDTAVGELGDAVQWIAIERTAPAEREFVEKYGLKAAPMPLALSFAPNGAIIGGFLGARLTEQQLVDALASPGMQACLKALQDRKLVFLCAQNGTTKSNDTAMKGVDEFKGDARFTQFTEIVKVDPSDAAEKKFLA